MTQRGNGRAQIFFDDGDYALYRNLLREHCAAASVAVWAGCLMPNHVHLALVPSDPDGIRRALPRVHRLYAGHDPRAAEADGAFLAGTVRLGGDGRGASSRGPPLRRAEPGAGRAGRPRAGLAVVERRAHVGVEDTVSPRPSQRAERVPDFAALLSAAEDVEAVARLRRAESVGRPIGSVAFLEELERRYRAPASTREAGASAREQLRGNYGDSSLNSVSPSPARSEPLCAAPRRGTAWSAAGRRARCA